MEIRPLAKADLADYKRVRLRALIEEPLDFGEDASEFRKCSDAELLTRFGVGHEDERLTLGAFVGDKLVGLTAYGRETMLKQRHKMNIWSVYVAPEQRRKGIARAMVEEALKRLRTIADVTVVQLGVTLGSNGPKALYESCGFKSYGVIPRQMRVGETYIDEEVMALFLK